MSDPPDLDQALDNAFEGRTNSKSLGEAYKTAGYVFIKSLLDNGHEVSAFLALGAFIDEMLNDLLESSLYERDTTSSLDRMNTRAKIDILYATEVINNGTKSQLSEFWSNRNDFAHRASEHVYSEEEEARLKKAFKQGLRGYESLIELHPEYDNDLFGSV